MILPCPSGSDNQGFGVLIFSLAGRAVSKPASLGSGRRVFPIGDRRADRGLVGHDRRSGSSNHQAVQLARHDLLGQPASRWTAASDYGPMRGPAQRSRANPSTRPRLHEAVGSEQLLLRRRGVAGIGRPRSLYEYPATSRDGAVTGLQDQYELTSDRLVRTVGFRPIPVDEIGLYK
jgi:hypothetical protein